MQQETTTGTCLNCGTELHGEYCHGCGQRATDSKPTVMEFILEYLNNAFMWDTYFFKTFWQLIRRPGHLTTEYVSGKYISYMHPLKLNMFMLFLFLTIFFFFRDTEDLNNSLHTVTRDETMQPILTIEFLKQEAEYMEKIVESPTDTVRLYTTSRLFETHSDIITCLDQNITEGTDSVGSWNVIVPQVLIEDEVIILASDGSYHFTNDDNTNTMGLGFVEDIWSNMVDLTTRYIPIFILLTTPFLAFVLRLLFRKDKSTHFQNFIFSLHYISFLELLIIFIYILHLIASPSVWLMQWILLIVSSVYLTISIRKVYGLNKWHTAVRKAIFTNFGYMMILTVLLFILVLASIIISAFKYVA